MKTWKIIARILGLDGKWFYRSVLMTSPERPVPSWELASRLFTTYKTAKVGWDFESRPSVKSACGAFSAAVREAQARGANVESGVIRWRIDLEIEQVVVDVDLQK